MPVEFIGTGATNDETEARPRSSRDALDSAFTLELARVHQRTGWDRVLLYYGSGAPDPMQVAAYLTARLDRLGVTIAHRPNASHPTHAARAFATLDQLSAGRVSVHVITGGGGDAEQAREGDTLDKSGRYQRAAEYMQVMKKVWTSRQRFDHHGTHYRFDSYLSDVFPHRRPGPSVSFGGTTPEAVAVGAAEADVYCLWIGPLATVAEQIGQVRQAAARAGRAAPPRIQLSVQPVLAATDELALEKARLTLGTVRARMGGRPAAERSAPFEGGRHHDRALWVPERGPAVLVGAPATVAAALLDYYRLGVRIFSVRGFDFLLDAEEFGSDVIPLVRDAVARQEAGRAD
ncbi:LLM class flavin-dependent oxidoreductase [Kitasatospora sp. NBC_01266]|uniref:LLM class flavin-dependent oxidoreductase n=1 Tax=Kitasatospora sp. NBC_01266 TaxID=2903572 RepID=UPI002E30C040|nr:LLM class flavin-dependent oxidoreductase [Kitasatospora sp. NBC_01266]